MLKVGFIGWHGMVGSVLMSRMIESKDFNDISPTFFDILNRTTAFWIYATIWHVTTRCQ